MGVKKKIVKINRKKQWGKKKRKIWNKIKWGCKKKVAVQKRGKKSGGKKKCG